MDRKIAARAAALKIRHQFGRTPVENLYFAVVEKAILDTSLPVYKRRGIDINARYKGSARRYLEGSIPHAEACGVDPNWVRQILQGVGLLERTGTLGFLWL